MSDVVSIFLVEDNPWDVWLIEETLRRRGIEFQLEQVSTVEQGLRMLKNFNVPEARIPDLILLDHNLPIGNGCDILVAIQDYPNLANVPKVMITTFLSPFERERANRLGAHCISKPSSLHRFFTDVGNQLAEVLANSRGREQATGSIS